MNAKVIDTLRYADGLKAAGVEARQAEAMSRALNAELTEGIATKRDLDDAVAGVKNELGARIDALEHKVEVGFAMVDAKFEAMNTRFEAVDAKFEAVDAKFEAVDAKFEALEDKLSALGSQNRYVFLVLALIVALGLYNAVAPAVTGKTSQPMAPSQPVATAAQPEAGASPEVP